MKFSTKHSFKTSTLFFFISLLVVILIFSTCKKKEDGGTDPQAVEFYEIFNVLDVAQDKFYEYANVTLGDIDSSLNMTKDWILQDPTVSDAEVFDETYLRILMKSGLMATFAITRTDNDGKSLFRGSGESSKVVLTKFSANENLYKSIAQTKKIENKNVLFFTPAYTEFEYNKTGDIERFAKMITDEGDDFHATILRDSSCTFDKIKTFGDYGFVVIDTHGFPDGFMTGLKVFLETRPKDAAELNTAIIDQLGDEVFNFLNTGYAGVAGQFHINVDKPDWYKDPKPVNIQRNIFATTKFINSLAQWNNTVIFGNMCYSGSDKVYRPQYYSMPLIRSAFLNRGLISYYGYTDDNNIAYLAEDNFCKRCEDTLINSLFARRDSTGQANLLKVDGTEFWDPYVFETNHKKQYFRHFLFDNYSYSNCGEPFTDERDGEIYQTVCIGKQVWMVDNLRYNAAGSGYYENDTSYLRIYGRLYPWDVVMNGASSSETNPSGVQGVCPKGWHLPSPDEWLQLMNSTGAGINAGAHVKDTLYWQNSVPGTTNSTGFSARPGGYSNKYFGNYVSLGSFGHFWTSKEQTLLNQAYRITLFYNSQNWQAASDTKEDAYSCRCLKD